MASTDLRGAPRPHSPRKAVIGAMRAARRAGSAAAAPATVVKIAAASTIVDTSAGATPQSCSCTSNPPLGQSNAVASEVCSRVCCSTPAARFRLRNN
jgi:hypothetical protein